MKVRVATEQGAPLAGSQIAIWEENGNVGLLAVPAGDSLAPAVFFGPASELGLAATGPAGVVVTAAVVGSILVVSSVALAMGKLTAALNTERKAWQRIDGYLGQQPLGQPFCASTDELVSLLRDYQIAQSGESGKVVVMSLAMAGATAYVPPGVSEGVESLMLANEVAYAEDWFDEIVLVDESELRSLWADGLGQAPGDFPFAGQRWQIWLDPIDTPRGIPTNGPRWDLERIVLVPNEPSCILPPQITTTNLPSGVVGQSYSASLSASGGDGSYVWSITQGSLPAGLSLNGNVIAGSPTAQGTSSFTAQVASAGSNDTEPLSITVQAASPFGPDEFILVQPGTFRMGGGTIPDVLFHTVNITRPFLLQRTEVTQEQWVSVMGTNPSRFSGCPTCPVESISWGDAMLFIFTLNTLYPGQGFRLPTEAEWEYAARAGSTGPYAGNGVPTDMGWVPQNSQGRTWPVASKLPNAWGFYDMHGNVLEFCQDWYDSSYYQRSPLNDPTGPASGTYRVMRGGSWDSGSAQSYNRYVYNPFCPNCPPSNGLRLARTP